MEGRRLFRCGTEIRTEGLGWISTVRGINFKRTIVFGSMKMKKIVSCPVNERRGLMRRF